MWSFSGPHPRPSRISIVMLRDTTSREARSLADGAYLGEMVWGLEGWHQALKGALPYAAACGVACSSGCFQAGGRMHTGPRPYTAIRPGRRHGRGKGCPGGGCMCSTSTHARAADAGTSCAAGEAVQVQYKTGRQAAAAGIRPVSCRPPQHTPNPRPSHSGTQAGRGRASRLHGCRGQTGPRRGRHPDTRAAATATTTTTTHHLHLATQPLSPHVAHAPPRTIPRQPHWPIAPCTPPPPKTPPACGAYSHPNPPLASP